jgi:hypothetical protein
MMRIEFIEEPTLLFGSNGVATDPRDGLLLYGPYEKWGQSFRFNNFSISAGVVGTKDALAKYRTFVTGMKQPIISVKRNKRGKLESNEIQRPSFPGFETVFNVHWPYEPDIFVEIKSIEIEAIFAQTRNRRIRTGYLVDLYLERMIKATRGEDARVNIWFVLVPKKIYENCRTLKGFGNDFSKRVISSYVEYKSGATLPFTEEDMFGEEIGAHMDSTSDFHHLLKARANQHLLEAPLQIIVEPKLEFRSIETNIQYNGDMKAHLAWSLGTTLYYKLGKKPWRLAEIRKGVCYLGLVFKHQQGLIEKDMVCSAAQLFLSDGDGTVFRGNNGLWISEGSFEHHLDEKESYNLLSLALTDYHSNNDSTYPVELFIHGKAVFSDAEWTGFRRAVEETGADIQLTGIVIQDKAPLKLFRDVEGAKCDYGVMRGIAAVISETEAYLFTRGFVPRLNTSTSLEIPNPLNIRVTRGAADIRIVLRDILALTKLNYNSCIYGDGKPVTLRFSDTIGSILTATENWKEDRRQFQFYI